jgi:hypothetical protein
VFLTTTISNVNIKIVKTVLARDVSLGQCKTKSEAVQLRHTRSVSQGQPSSAIETAGEFDLHETLPFPWLQRQDGKGFLIKIKRDTHGESLPSFGGRVKGHVRCKTQP